MSLRERGQAAVEMVVVGGLVAAVVGGGAGGLRIMRAQDAAERTADTAAVLVAEHRPIPARLRRDAHIRVSAGAVRASVRACALGAGIGCFDLVVTARVP